MILFHSNSRLLNLLHGFSAAASLSVFYSLYLMIVDKKYLLDGRGSSIEVDYFSQVTLALLTVSILFLHPSSFRRFQNLAFEKSKSNQLTFFSIILIVINFILWKLFSYGEFSELVLPGAYFISLFSLQYIIPIYASTAKGWFNWTIVLIGSTLALLRGSTAPLFFIVVIGFSRFWLSRNRSFFDLFKILIIIVFTAFFANEAKMATRGILSDLNFFDYGLARLNQFSNLILLYQNINLFNSTESNFVPQIIYEAFAYIIPNSILNYNPYFDYEFEFTEIITSYSGIISYTTTTYLGKLFLYINLGLYGSFLIYLLAPFLIGYGFRYIIIKFKEFRFIPLIYTIEVMFFLSGNFMFLTKFSLLLFIFIFLLNIRLYKLTHSISSHRKLDSLCK